MINFICVIGIYALSCYLYDNLKSPILILRRRLKQLWSVDQNKSLKEQYGSWAVITGATDGIGKAYARELARRDLNVVLISRTESKLKAVAKEIETEYQVQTKIIVADFALGERVYEHIESGLNDIPIGILINNVGQSTKEPDSMSSFDARELWNVIYTNIGAATQLSRYFLQRMQAQNIKNGAIVNISSVTDLQPVAYGAIYAASKAYIRSLTLALQQEARFSGITIQLVSPNFVSTKINSYSDLIMRGNLLIPDAATYARWAVNTIGVVDETTGYFWHGVVCALLKILPSRLRTLLFLPCLKFLINNNSKIL